jgi:hypothetical protein
MKDLDLNQPINTDIHKNEQIFRKVFENADDIIYRKLEAGKTKNLKMLLLYVENAVFVDAPESKEEVEIVESEEIEEGQEDRE